MFKRSVNLSTSFNFNQILSGTSKNVSCRSAIHCQNARLFSSDTVARKWDLYSAVCLERHPIIVQPMQDIELKFSEMLKQIEYENSLKSDHELRNERDLKQKLSIKKNINFYDDNEAITLQTAQDFEDNCQEELNNFKLAPTTTKCDNKGITTSLNRKLDKSLLLLVEQKVGDTKFLIPPQGIRKEGETMRQTAERVLKDLCGTEIKVQFYGNAPIGFYKYKYPKEVSEKGTYGAKIFYFLTKYVEGNIVNDVKYQWLDNQELEKVLPGGVRNSISQFMLCS